MERAIEILAAVQFLVLGLSHVFRPRAWVECFVELRKLGHTGVFAHGVLSLWFGSVVVAFHGVWSGTGVVLTVVGWAYVLKSLVCFVAPELGLHSLARVAPERAYEFGLAGAAYLALAVLLGYRLLAS